MEMRIDDSWVEDVGAHSVDANLDFGNTAIKY